MNLKVGDTVKCLGKKDRAWGNNVPPEIFLGDEKLVIKRLSCGKYNFVACDFLKAANKNMSHYFDIDNLIKVNNIKKII